jgi:hypothetical protein
MPEKQHKAAEEEGACEVGLWYISFADMITLLLSFFVMLTSFSSFDSDSMNQIQETAKAYPSVVSYFRSRNNNVMDPMIDPGNECPVQTFGTETDVDPTLGVEHSEMGPSAALIYNGRKIIRLPLESMFLGNSSVLSPSGKKCVELLAKYLSATPYRIRLATGGTDETLALTRQWKVASLLAEKGVDMKHIGLALPDPAGNASQQAQLVLTLLPQETFR